MKEITVLVGHFRPDWDCINAIELYKKMIANEVVIIRFFGENGKVNIPESARRVIFLDVTPNIEFLEKLRRNGCFVEIFDHHQEGMEEETATSLVIQRIREMTEKRIEIYREEVGDLPLMIKSIPYELSLNRMKRWSMVADKKGAGDDLNIASVMGKMSRIFTDLEIYKWGSWIVSSELANKTARISSVKCVELFKSCLVGFLEKKDVATRQDFARILERLEGPEIAKDPMHLVAVAGVVVLVYGEEGTKDWLIRAFQAIAEQKIARRKQLKTIEYDVVVPDQRYPNGLVVIGISKSSEFASIAREQVKKMTKEKYARIIVPIVVQLQVSKKTGALKGFQIYSNGFDDLRELVKFIRVEILRKRGGSRDCHWQELIEYGEMKGTDPLFYNSEALNKQIFWSSLKHPKKQKPPFSVQELRDMIVKVMDREYYPEQCIKSSVCLGRECIFFNSQLMKCGDKKREWREQKFGCKGKKSEKDKDNFGNGSMVIKQKKNGGNDKEKK